MKKEKILNQKQYYFNSVALKFIIIKHLIFSSKITVITPDFFILMI